MSKFSKAALVIAAVVLASTLARSDGIFNPTSNQAGFTDGFNNLTIGVTTPPVPPPAGSALLADNTNPALLADNTNPACLAGGC